MLPGVVLGFDANDDPAQSWVDIHTLLRVDGVWKIMAKTATHASRADWAGLGARTQTASTNRPKRAWRRRMQSSSRHDPPRRQPIVSLTASEDRLAASAPSEDTDRSAARRVALMG
jgi:hypothetical protein